MAIKKKVALYISSPEEANVLRERCAPIKPMLEIGLMKTFGAEPAADSFKKIHALMTNKEADLDWVIFHLPSVSQMIGSAVFLNELKKLIRAKAVEQTKTYIIDSGASMNSEGRAAFERFRVHIVDDESYIGDVFAKILDPNQLDIAAAAQEDPLFEGLIDDSPRLPGMRSDTPSTLNKSESDPFDDFDAALATEEEDPFAKSEAKKKVPDPFAAFNVSPTEMENNPFAGSSQSSPADPFSEFDFDDPPAPNPFAPAGPGAAIMADRADPFSSLDNPIPGGAADPFAAWNSSSTVSRNAGTPTAPDPNDPFAVLRGQAGTPAPQADDLGNFGEFDDFNDPFADADLGNPEFVDQNHVSMPVVSGNNPSMPMNNNATAARGPAPVPQKSDELLFDDLGGVNDPNMGIEDDLSGGFDPFANIPENGFPQPVNGNGQGQRGFGAPPAMSSALAASARPPARATRPPAPTYNDEYYDDYDNGYDDYDDYDDYDGYDDGYDDYNDRPPSRGGGGGMGLMTVEQLLEEYGDNLGDNDYLKMKSMMEPKWDYIMEKEDKIGAAGGFKLQIGKKGALKGISQVNSDDLANSIYIKEVEAEKGYYSPPNECKVVSIWSPKGGPGKALPISEKILYFDQAKRQIQSGVLGDIKVGDKVFNTNGELVDVLEVHDQPTPLQSYKLSLSDGRTIRCSEDHIWSVLKRGSNKSKDKLVQKTTSDLLEVPLLKNDAKGHGEYRWKIPVSSSIKDFPEQELPIPPYVMGILIGDGYLASKRHATFVSSADEEVIHELERQLDYAYIIERNSLKNYTWEFKRNPAIECSTDITDELEKLNLRHKTTGKFIPDIYKYSSREQRQELLQGLMDSDGTARRGRFGFTTINERLRDDVMWLMRSLGYICSYSLDYRPEKYQNSDGKCWNISLQTNDDNVFKLGRKKKAAQEYKSRQTKVEILPMPSEPKTFDDDPNLPMSPYIYGMICMKQQTSSVQIRGSSEYIIKNAIDALPQGTRLVPQNTSKDGSAYTIQNTDSALRENIVKAILRSLGEDGRNPKTHGINPIYLRASVAERKALLQGIMDARGTWTNKGFPAFVPQNAQMKTDFINLLENLGYTWSVPSAKKNNYMIAIETQDLSIFGDVKKREIMKNWLFVTGKADGRSQMERDYQYVSITNIEKTNEFTDMRCLYVDDPAHMFLVGDFIPTHNTTVSVMLATQLNWYFNPELMQNLTTSYTARILLMSLNEFDDIPTHGIGYDEYLSDENDNDGKNIVELVRRIDETNGEPSWDDISYCFVATRANKVFYLPSLTQREQITGNIVVTPQDYKKVIDVCSKFFSFVIMDSPDLFYHEKADIMNFAFSVSDIICFVIEPDTHSTTHLYHFFDGLRGDTNKFPLDSNKCICVVNKYVTSGNVYMPVEPIGQLKFEKIATSMSKYFARFVAIPFSQPRSYGNILDGTDPKVKYAAAELADDVLELIDYNDEVEEKKKQQRQRRR